METSVLNQILDQHKLWIDGKGGICANLEGANLTGAYLSGANLTGANLENADLRGADLRGANLTTANLTGANLTTANLTGANLTTANLIGANLTGADLTGANLCGAKFSDADLSGADLSSAKLSDAILPDISWIIPGCLVQLNQIKYNFYLKKENKHENFAQDSLGFFIQDNREEKTFDMLVEDRIIRNIPDWVKFSGLRQVESESVCLFAATTIKYKT